MPGHLNGWLGSHSDYRDCYTIRLLVDVKQT